MPLDDSSSDDFDSSSAGDQFEEATSSQQVELIRGGAILLMQDGFEVLSPRRRGRQPKRYSYQCMTHVCAADRMLLVGLTSGLLTIRNRDFLDPEEGPKQASRLLLERLAMCPNGNDRLEEMADIDRLGTRNSWSVITWTVVALCIVGTWIQLLDPMITQIGSFIPDLFVRGEYWRGVTGHFLHGLSSAPALLRFFLGNIAGLPFHLAINVGGLIVLGHLVERPMGSWRTAECCQRTSRIARSLRRSPMDAARSPSRGSQATESSGDRKRRFRAAWPCAPSRSKLPAVSASKTKSVRSGQARKPISRFSMRIRSRSRPSESRTSAFWPRSSRGVPFLWSEVGGRGGRESSHGAPSDTRITCFPIVRRSSSSVSAIGTSSKE